MHLAAQRTLDDVVHPTRVVRGSHPDHLASIATLFGMSPQPVDRCRVLELGCAAGWNLFPMVDRHPQSRFVGVDGAAEQISEARRAAALLKYENVEFHELGLDKIDEQLGTFDYIICHDVYSRIAPRLQPLLLDVCRARLNPQGVIYISYRALPGWIAPGVVRELVRSGSADGEPLAHRIAASRQMLRFVSDSIARDAGPFGRLLKAEAELALALPDASLVHEHVCVESHPTYLFDFVERAAKHGLNYLGDSEIRSMFAAPLGPAIEEALMQIARHAVSLEQHVDLLCNRSFHRSLLCHRDVSQVRQWQPAGLERLRLVGNLQPDGAPVDPLSDELAKFVAPGGAVISTRARTLKLAIAHLREIWPRCASFDEICRAVGGRLTDDGRGTAALAASDRDELAKNLIDCIANEWIEPHADVDRFTVEISEYPRVSNWARAELSLQLDVTNRRHETVALDEVTRGLLRYVDGTRDRAALLAVLVDAAERGELSIIKGGIPATRDASANTILEQVLDQSLARLAETALLVA